MIPNLLTTVQTYRIASRLHVKRGRPTYLGPICIGGLFALSLYVGWHAAGATDNDPFPN